MGGGGVSTCVNELSLTRNGIFTYRQLTDAAYASYYGISYTTRSLLQRLWRRTVATRQWTAIIVEDDPALLGMLSDVLEDADFTTSCHTTGRSAINALWQQRFDLMVIDVNLPDMNGLKLCPVVREQYGEDTVILVITAARIQDRRVTSLEVGADDFLAKPFDLDEFLARIDVKLRRLSAAHSRRDMGPGEAHIHSSHVHRN